MYVEDVPERPTQAQLRLVRAHLPYSLPILRRLQVAAGAFDGLNSAGTAGSGTSAYAHVLIAYDVSVPNEVTPETPFAVAFLDISQAPETAAWIYASDEDGLPGESIYAADNNQPATWVVDRGASLIAGWSSERRARCRRLVLALLRHARAIAHAVAPQLAQRVLERFTGAQNNFADFTAYLKANIHDGIRYILQNPDAAETGTSSPAGAVTTVYFDAYDKWLFRFEDIPVLSLPADTVYEVPPGPDAAGDHRTLIWDRVRSHDDASLVKSRTRIPRSHATLLSVPSVALRDEATGTLQAWAFVGIDGSLWSLHTEPAYRGRGLAKTLAARMLRQYCGVFDAMVEGGGGDGGEGDGWCAADVSAHNPQSQGVLRRLGAKRTWSTAWIIINYDSLGDDE